MTFLPVLWVVPRSGGQPRLPEGVRLSLSFISPYRTNTSIRAIRVGRARERGKPRPQSNPSGPMDPTCVLTRTTQVDDGSS